jgi:hypothetical protein
VLQIALSTRICNAIKSGGATTKTAVYESKHDYDNNTDTTYVASGVTAVTDDDADDDALMRRYEIAFPGAIRIDIVFDAETRTESGVQKQRML